MESIFFCFASSDFDHNIVYLDLFFRGDGTKSTLATADCDSRGPGPRVQVPAAPGLARALPARIPQRATARVSERCSAKGRAMSGSENREVVLVGGGHAHIHVLERALVEPLPDARLTLLVDTPIAVYSGMVPGFVAGQYRAEELEIDVVALAEKAGARTIVTPAVSVDSDARLIHVAEGPPVPYDIVSWDIGSTVAGLDLPGVREHALPTRPIRLFVQRMSELVERARTHDRSTPFHVVVVGAGAGGVELAFTIDHRLRHDVSDDIRMTLLDSGPRILARYSDSLRRRVRKRARQRGIEILLDASVAAAESDALVLDDGTRLPCDALIWVTGAVSHPLFIDSGLKTDARGFVLIRSTLQFDQYDEQFAVGDCGTLIEYPQTPKAGVYAVREGPVITDNLYAALRGEPLRSYKPQGDFLTLLNLGDGTAVGAKWGLSFGGRWVMRWKDHIDKKFMHHFQSL
jgi:selenide,water dikinase